MKQQKLTDYRPNYPRKALRGAALTAAALVAVGSMAGCVRVKVKVPETELQAEGMVAGVADLILMYPNADHHGLCIEMKTKEGTQRPTQKAWQEAVERYGYRYVVVRDIDTFISTIQNYIGK